MNPSQVKLQSIKYPARTGSCHPPHRRRGISLTKRSMEVIDLHEPKVEELNSKKRNCTKDADRIGNLPDAIIHHILSFLCIIDVVRTSMLARRWRYLWTESSNLIVDDVLVDSEDKFSNMLNSVQKMYKSLNIGRCTLSVQKPCNAKSVNAWVHVAVQRNVKELHVNALTVKPLEVPCCRALKELKLDLHERLLVLPNSGCFSALESFSLSRVQVNGDAFADVISNRCPHLRSLNLEECRGLDYLNISCPTLEVLKIIYCLGLSELNVSAEKLQILSVQRSFTFEFETQSVMISCPNLQTFEWLDYVIDNCHIGSFTSLKVALISLVFDYYLETIDSYKSCAKKFLSRILCAESLQLEMPCFGGLSIHKEVLEGLPTQPYNLKHLKLLVGHDIHVFHGISHLLESCTNLEVLHISVNDEETEEIINEKFQGSFFFNNWEFMDYRRAPLNHLLKVYILGFRGTESEIEFVQVLLEYAVVLESMIILFSDEALPTQEMKSEIKQKLAEINVTSSADITYIDQS